MPTYEYRCAACDHELEAFQSMTAKPLKKCPACGKLKLERLISGGAGVLFKGDGFYETDYRSESYTKAAKADQEAAKPKADAKTDNKAETKSDAKAAATKPDAKPSTKSKPAKAAD